MRSVTAVAPGRVNLIGEHTDYHRGQCLPFAIDLATTVTVTARGDERLLLRSAGHAAWAGSVDPLDPGPVSEWTRYVVGVVRGLQQRGWELPGLDVDITTTLPLGGGLSSSAALECAVATAVAGLVGRPPRHQRDRRDLAEVCRIAETEYVGAPTGGMDQLAVMLGRAGHGVHLDFGSTLPRARRVPMPLAEAGLVILVTDTGVRHRLADGDGGYAQRRRESLSAAAALGVPHLALAGPDDLPQLADPVLRRRVRHVVSENARVEDAVVLLAERDWRGLGALLTASHESLRDDYEVSCPELDLAVEGALRAGALGARLTGGGFGGCSIALTDEGRVDAVRDGIDAAFASAALRPPVHHQVQPADGARLT